MSKIVTPRQTLLLVTKAIAASNVETVERALLGIISQERQQALTLVEKPKGYESKLDMLEVKGHPWRWRRDLDFCDLFDEAANCACGGSKDDMEDWLLEHQKSSYEINDPGAFWSAYLRKVIRRHKR